MPETDTSRFYFTRTASVLQSCSGTLSFFSSATIIYIILKSKSNTEYHRIMVFMAFWDMVSSSMFAISTIPMPKDVIYPYGGPSFGNIRTCEAQAFLIWVGIPFTSSTNMLLNIYYLCTVRYKINEPAPSWIKYNRHCSCITDWLDSSKVQENRYSSRYRAAIVSKKKIGQR